MYNEVVESETDDARGLPALLESLRSLLRPSSSAASTFRSVRLQLSLFNILTNPFVCRAAVPSLGADESWCLLAYHLRRPMCI